MKYKKLFYYILLAVLILYILVLDDSSFLQRYKTKKRLDDLKNSIQVLKNENLRLKKENEKLKNDDFTWEKKARELGMKKKDEEIFRFKKHDE